VAYCSECGAEISPKAEICLNCGVRQITANPIPGGKSRITAAILAFFLGGLGVHKFYMGKTGQGVLYLLFCWTFIPSIIAFIEFIIYLTESDAAFAARLI